MLVGVMAFFFWHLVRHHSSEESLFQLNVMKKNFATEARLSTERTENRAMKKTDNNTASPFRQQTSFCSAGHLESVLSRMASLDSKEKHVEIYFSPINAEAASLANCNVRKRLRTWRMEDHHRQSVRLG